MLLTPSSGSATTPWPTPPAAATSRKLETFCGEAAGLLAGDSGGRTSRLELELEVPVAPQSKSADAAAGSFSGFSGASCASPKPSRLRRGTSSVARPSSKWPSFLCLSAASRSKLCNWLSAACCSRRNASSSSSCCSSELLASVLASSRSALRLLALRLSSSKCSWSSSARPFVPCSSCLSRASSSSDTLMCTDCSALSFSRSEHSRDASASSCRRTSFS
mmetsp:Transcript_61247/g.108916  ORF Transcript_61247/g.108916 Transcript_61247/m.108916 type:complete len:220 (-) Transcript_61247:1786-2445(-)